MKKNITYTVLVVFMMAAIAFIWIKYSGTKTKKEQQVYALLQRKGNMAKAPEWPVVKENSIRLQKMIEVNPGDKKSLVALANLCIMEARATGNFAYYDAAAMKYIDKVLKTEPHHFEALTLKALIQMSQHHFSEGLITAQTAAADHPYNAFVQGVLVDGYVETGKYDSAVAAAEKMMSIRPDLRSYARASYLREIYGDIAGAIEAMQLAIQAGAPGDEATEWCRVQLGKLYEHNGDVKNAAMQYNISLSSRPGYAHALAGMARIAAAEKNYTQAIDYYTQAAAETNSFTYREELADVYVLAGQKEKAESLYASCIQQMEQAATAAKTDESLGHYTDQELARAYIKTGNYSKALEYALAEYNRRPANIEVNETLAWVYYKQGGYAKALPYIQAALKTNSSNPSLLCRAGLIFMQAGAGRDKSVELLTAALKNNPNILESIKTEGSLALQQLKKI